MFCFSEEYKSSFFIRESRVCEEYKSRYLIGESGDVIYMFNFCLLSHEAKKRSDGKLLKSKPKPITLE